MIDRELKELIEESRKNRYGENVHYVRYTLNED